MVTLITPPPQVTEALRPYLKFRLMVTLLSIIFFSYPGVTSTLLSFFNCPQVRGGGRGGRCGGARQGGRLEAGVRGRGPAELM